MEVPRVTMVDSICVIYLSKYQSCMMWGVSPFLDHFRTPPHGISIIKNLGYMIYDTYHTVNIT